MKSFFEAFLNFDVKIFHSLRDIWKPNRITKTFLEGKREYHIHPFRFYFICLIIFFTLLSIHTKNIEYSDFDLNKVIQEYEFYQEFDSISRQYVDQCEIGVMDSIKLRIHDEKDQFDTDTFFNVKLFGSDLTKYGINTHDAVRLSNETLFEKYKIESKKDQYLISQHKRVVLYPESATRFFIGNLIWGLILLTLMMAFVLKLLYIRHDSYYIEHLLHIANFHCLTLLVVSILMLVNLFYPLESYPEFNFLAILGGVFYLLVALKLYYGENIFKSLLKIMILGFAYMVCIIIILTIIGIFSLAIF